MIISQWMSENYPQMKVELDINDVATLFKRQPLEIITGTNKPFKITLDTHTIPVPLDVMFGRPEEDIMINVSEEAFCDLLKDGSAQYLISDGACINAKNADKRPFDYDTEATNLMVMLILSKRGM